MGIRERYSRLKPLPADTRKRLEEVPSVLMRHPIRLAYVFGSIEQDPETAADVDLAVLSEDGFSYAALYADLSLVLGTDRLDVVDLQAASMSVRWEVVTTGRCVFGRPGTDAEAYAQRVRSLYRDTRLRWLQLESFISGRSAALNLRREFLLQSLAELERVAQELEKYEHVTTDDLNRDLSLRWTIERGLLAGLSLVFRIAEHILAAHFHRFPETFEGLLLELRDVGVLRADLYETLKGSGGFRNVLVHEYVKVELRQVEAALRDAASMFRAYARAVGDWLEGI